MFVFDGIVVFVVDTAMVLAAAAVASWEDFYPV
jgi:hypothetical protein